MSRTAAARAVLGADKPNAAAILALVQSIERAGETSPAAAAYRSALVRKGREAHAAGGPALLDELQRKIATADPDRAETRTAIVREAWDDLAQARP